MIVSYLSDDVPVSFLPAYSQLFQRGLSWLYHGVVFLSLSCVCYRMYILVSKLCRGRIDPEFLQLPGLQSQKLADRRRAVIFTRRQIMHLAPWTALLCLSAWHSLFTPSTWHNSEIKREAYQEPLKVFQVYKPVPGPSRDSDTKECIEEVLLMEHVFGWSYGRPFVGEFYSKEVPF
jgi:hypothetical protein